MAKLSKTKVKDIILDYLKNEGFTVKTIQALGGYFIFDMGKNSVFHITFKEIPGWKFGMWLQWTDEKKKNELQVDFFGDKIDWINKFKPTQTPIANRVVVKSYKELEDQFGKIWDLFQHSTDGFDSNGEVLEWMRSLRLHRHMTEYFLYDHSKKSYFKFLWDEFTFYTLYKGFCNFYEKHMLPWHVKFTAFVWKHLFKKHLMVKAIYDTREHYFMHPYDIVLEYREGATNEELWNIYWFIEKKSLLNKWCNLFRKHVGEVSIRHCEYGSKRGFYFPEPEEMGEAV